MNHWLAKHKVELFSWRNKRQSLTQISILRIINFELIDRLSIALQKLLIIKAKLLLERIFIDEIWESFTFLDRSVVMSTRKSRRLSTQSVIKLSILILWKKKWWRDRLRYSRGNSMIVKSPFILNHTLVNCEEKNHFLKINCS